jgi:hypothetical protein
MFPVAGRPPRTGNGRRKAIRRLAGTPRTVTPLQTPHAIYEVQLSVGGVRLPTIGSARDVSWVVSLMTVAVTATVVVPPAGWHTEGYDDASSQEDGSKDQIGEDSDMRHVVPPWSLVVRRRCGTALHDEWGAGRPAVRVG